MIEKIIEKIGVVKAIHALLCFVISVLVSSITNIFTSDKATIICLGWLVAFLVSTVYEVVTEFKKKNSENNFVPDIIGATSGMLCVLSLVLI